MLDIPYEGAPRRLAKAIGLIPSQGHFKMMENAPEAWNGSIEH